MRHNGTQAFLRLLGRDGGTVGPAIQYLRGVVVTADEAVLAATGGRFRATADRPEKLSSGRLAFQWFPEDEADCVRRDFPVLASLAWKALQAATSPHVEIAATGELARRYRIGPAAEAWALSRPELPLQDYALQLKIRPARGATGSPPARPAHWSTERLHLAPTPPPARRRDNDGPSRLDYADTFRPLTSVTRPFTEHSA
jgi:hypothetical protein